MDYPEVGVAIAVGELIDGKLAQHAQPVARDGVVLECELEPSETPYIVVPYLQALPARPPARATDGPLCEPYHAARVLPTLHVPTLSACTRAKTMLSH